MLNEIGNALTGTLTTSTYTYPGATNTINIPPRITFKNFFNNFISSLTSNPAFGGMPTQEAPPAGIPGYGAGLPPGIGTLANPGVFNRNINARVSIKNKSRALSPGSYINSFQNSAIKPSATRPLQVAPLQGFAGQTGIVNPAFGNSVGPVQSQFGAGLLLPQSNARGGILPMLIMPIVGLFSVLTSVFNIRKLINGFKPVETEKSTIYNNYTNYLDEVYASRGSFEPSPEFEIEEESLSKDFDLYKLQDF